jgi:hypothetical protein
MEADNKENNSDARLKNLEPYKFKKGQSGNPGGRPKKEFSITNALRELLGEQDPYAKIERYKVILGKAIEKAGRGDNDMIKYLINRLEGTPTFKSEAKDEIQANLNISDAEVLDSAYEWVAKDKGISVEELRAR